LPGFFRLFLSTENLGKPSFVACLVTIFARKWLKFSNYGLKTLPLKLLSARKTPFAAWKTLFSTRKTLFSTRKIQFVSGKTLFAARKIQFAAGKTLFVAGKIQFSGWKTVLADQIY
jgi:hypothetical protein